MLFEDLMPFWMEKEDGESKNWDVFLQHNFLQ